MKKVISIPIILLLLVYSSKGDFMTTNRENDLKSTVCSAFKPFFDALSSISNRKKRSTIALPNASAFVISSRLRIPQPPWGFYLVWIQVNFFIRPMFRDPVSYLVIILFCIGVSFILGVKVPVKRLHSRQRRFAASGAIWDVIFGINILWPDANLMFDIILRHELDDLFGGQDALQNRLMINSYEGRSAGLKNNTSNLNINILGRKKRSDEEDSYLVRSLEEDQVSILSKLEEAITKVGMNGRQCVLKTVCELQETPIHEWSLLGEMISVLFRPKKGNHSELFYYKKAEKLGSESGNCWFHYPKCPISIFNILPDLFTRDDEVNIDFDGGYGSEP